VLFVFYGDGAGRGVADRLDVYQDGVRLAEARRNGMSMDFSVDRWIVGAGGEDGASPFVGRLDELAIYDLSELSEKAITDRMVDMARRHVAAARGGGEE
jgi:hypothetical protein